MPARRLSPEETRALQDRINTDPNFRRVAMASYPSPMLRDQAIQNYLSNDPRSPMYGVNQGSGSRDRGLGSYRFNPDTGTLQFVATGPSSYFTHPGGIGRDAVLATTAAAGMGWLPGTRPPVGPGPLGGTAINSQVDKLMASGGGNAVTTTAGGVGNWLKNQFGGLGLKDYGAIGASLASMFGPGGLFNNPKTPGQEGLERIIGMAEGRIKQSEPLFQDLSALAGEDVGVARSRRAAGEPILQGLNARAQQGLAGGNDQILQALNAMASQQMPDNTRQG